MQITFYGAVREVTGSMHLIETGDNRILLDCGMFQGRRKESNEKNDCEGFFLQAIKLESISKAI